MKIIKTSHKELAKIEAVCLAFIKVSENDKLKEIGIGFTEELLAKVSAITALLLCFCIVKLS